MADLQGQDRGGQNDRGEGGADQHARRDRGLAAGQGGRGDRGDLAGGQAGHQDAVTERAGRHQVRDRPGQGREHGDAGEDRGEDAPPRRREAAQRPRVDRDGGGEDQDDEQHVDAVVGRQPGEGTLYAQADDRRGEDGGELRVGGQLFSAASAARSPRRSCRTWGSCRISTMQGHVGFSSWRPGWRKAVQVRGGVVGDAGVDRAGLDDRRARGGQPAEALAEGLLGERALGAGAVEGA